MRNLKAYIRYMRRQPKHMQHVHAFIFAGVITGIIAGVILYTDYGFWHERYRRSDDLTVVNQDIKPAINPESPTDMLSNFWKEAKKQVSNIGTSTTGLLEGKETYTR